MHTPHQLFARKTNEKPGHEDLPPLRGAERQPQYRVKLGDVRAFPRWWCAKSKKRTPVIVALPWSSLNVPLSGFVQAAMSASRLVLGSFGTLRPTNPP
jgi:hypothetical protein